MFRRPTIDDLIDFPMPYKLSIEQKGVTLGDPEMENRNRNTAAATNYLSTVQMFGDLLLYYEVV